MLVSNSPPLNLSRKLSVVLVSWLLFASPTTDAADLPVPGTFATIQEAIVAAMPGDVVLVAPGTYLESIDFLGKAIVVRSSDGPQTTSIDANQLGHVVSFTSGETSDSILEGFTITGAFPTQFSGTDGAIVCLDSSPTIRDNIIRDNNAHWEGAGIHCTNSSATIVDNEIELNSFFCLIADAPCGLGGGIFFNGGAPVVTHNVFRDNTAFVGGGAIGIIGDTNALIFNNVMLLNNGGNGGALLCESGTAEVRNNLFANNTAIGSTSLVGPLPGRGGAVATFTDATVTLVQNTIVENSALTFGNAGEGGGVSVESPNVTIRDCIFWLNQAEIGSEQIFQGPGSVAAVSYSNVPGGWPGVGNIDVDPLFLPGPDGDYYLSQTAAGQALQSPCVDAGDPNLPAPLGTTRTDSGADSGFADLGFHFGLFPDNSNEFLRGDVNGNGFAALNDAVLLLSFLFANGAPLICDDAADANDNGTLALNDAVILLSFLFASGAPPAAPGPFACGLDTSGDVLDCASFPACP